MKKLKAGVIGCGFIAQAQWLHYIHELEQYEMAALCDVSHELLEHTGKLYGVNRLYTDWRELLAQEDIEAVIILTNCHEDVCVAAAQAKKHVLVEKPLCENPAQAARIVEAVEKSGVTFMVGEMKRYDPGFLYAEKLFNELKDIWMIEAIDLSDGLEHSTQEICQIKIPTDIPKELLVSYDEAFEKGLRGVTGKLPGRLYEKLLICGVHFIDLLRAAFRDPEKVLGCDIWNDGNMVACEMKYGKDSRAFFKVGITNYKQFIEEITAYGKEKTVTVRFPNPLLKNAPTMVEVRETVDNMIVEQFISPSYEESFRNELVYFHECVTGSLTPRTSAQEGKKNLELLAAIFDCYARGAGDEG